MTEERKALLGELAQRLGHAFRDMALLDRALTHASRANEADAEERRDNEPPRVPGRCWAGLTVHDPPHNDDPDGSEGPKSRRRAASSPRRAWRAGPTRGLRPRCRGSGAGRKDRRALESRALGGRLRGGGGGAYLTVASQRRCAPCGGEFERDVQRPRRRA